MTYDEAKKKVLIEGRFREDFEILWSSEKPTFLYCACCGQDWIYRPGTKFKLNVGIVTPKPTKRGVCTCLRCYLGLTGINRPSGNYGWQKKPSQKSDEMSANNLVLYGWYRLTPLSASYHDPKF